MVPEQIERYMRMAIAEASRSTPEDKNKVRPKVAAVIVDEYGELVAKAFRNEDGHGGHAEFLAIEKAKRTGRTNFSQCTIFATLEPCTHRGHGKTPCAQRIVEAGFGCVYIGALDPNPVISGHGEIYLRERVEKVERFPGELDRAIRNKNRAFWNVYLPGHLPTSSMYVQKRIPDMLRTYLLQRQIDVPGISLDSGSSLHDLERIIIDSRRTSMPAKKLHQILKDGVATAFDSKYEDYTYETDARKIGHRWQREVPAIIRRFNVHDFTHRSIINVGFGNGEEGVGLFDDCTHFTGIDIAPQSLRRAQARFPTQRFICCSAEDLVDVKGGTQDIYISLRTYQSAFFDIDRAVEEAYRVLRPSGIVIISVANAYLEGSAFVRGLLPHGSSVVDRNEAHRQIADIRRQLLAYQFQDVGLHTGFAEEYVFGMKPVY